jgi:uncharacterized repeat protein (TIGR03803 family)
MRVRERLLLASLTLFAVSQGQAQFQVLHAFGSGNDGGGVWDSVAFDRAGNLYGTTSGGGAYGEGVVFELTPQTNGEWTESVLYSFCSEMNCADGVGAFGGVTLDVAGNLYGTTQRGGAYDFGVVFELTPNDGGWLYSVIHNLGGPGDLACCPWGNLIMDKHSNLYGTGGVAFELSRNPGGSWEEIMLHNFTGQNGDGYFPQAGPITDGAGNLYGTTGGGGGRPKCPGGCGTVYELLPTAMGISAHGVKVWAERILHRFPSFPNDGRGPSLGQLAIDGVGNLYGATGGAGQPVRAPYSS